MWLEVFTGVAARVYVITQPTSFIGPRGQRGNTVAEESESNGDRSREDDGLLDDDAGGK